MLPGHCYQKVTSLVTSQTRCKNMTLGMSDDRRLIRETTKKNVCYNTNNFDNLMCRVVKTCCFVDTVGSSGVG